MVYVSTSSSDRCWLIFPLELTPQPYLIRVELNFDDMCCGLWELFVVSRHPTTAALPHCLRITRMERKAYVRSSSWFCFFLSESVYSWCGYTVIITQHVGLVGLVLRSKQPDEATAVFTQWRGEMTIYFRRLFLNFSMLEALVTTKTYKTNVINVCWC